jgi:hypothetical protein
MIPIIGTRNKSTLMNKAREEIVPEIGGGEKFPSFVDAKLC